MLPEAGYLHNDISPRTCGAGGNPFLWRGVLVLLDEYTQGAFVGEPSLPLRAGTVGARAAIYTLHEFGHSPLTTSPGIVSSTMRVEMKLDPSPADPVSEIPWGTTGGGSESAECFFDLRENPSLLEGIASARQFPPLRNFLAAMNERDSFFFTARCKTSHAQSDPSSSGGGHEFAVRVEITSESSALNRDASEWRDAAARTRDLLTREPGGETLLLELTLRKCRYAASGQMGFSMQLDLRARGATPEQAQLRCGLGLARVQQALLFVSRSLRQRFGELN